MKIMNAQPYFVLFRVEFLLKTDSGYPKDTGVNKHQEITLVYVCRLILNDI